MRHFPMAMQQLGPTKAGLKAGEWILVMGASGGLGSACIQVARQRGAKVIAGAGGDERVAVALALGAEHGINYRRENLTERVREITGGHGADVICENISDPSTFPAAFAALATMGRLVTSGAHGGGTVPVDMKRLYHHRLRILGAAGHDPADIRDAMDRCRHRPAQGQGRPRPPARRITRRVRPDRRPQSRRQNRHRSAGLSPLRSSLLSFEQGLAFGEEGGAAFGVVLAGVGGGVKAHRFLEQCGVAEEWARMAAFAAATVIGALPAMRVARARARASISSGEAISATTPMLAARSAGKRSAGE